VGELKVRAWNDRCDMGMNDIRPRRDRDEDGDWGTERERERI